MKDLFLFTLFSPIMIINTKISHTVTVIVTVKPRGDFQLGLSILNTCRVLISLSRFSFSLKNPSGEPIKSETDEDFTIQTLNFAKIS